jgi:acyl-CoA thioester hydrolase
MVMESSNSQSKVFPRQIEIPIRVRYGETDQRGVVHHYNYFKYFEAALMEQLRLWDSPYGQIIDSGIHLVIIDMECKCRTPAFFDELIFIRARTHKMTPFRIVQHYEVRRENKETIAVGKQVLVSVSEEGLPVLLPKILQDVWLTLKEQTE